jgi:hypothetical protein
MTPDDSKILRSFRAGRRQDEKRNKPAKPMQHKTLRLNV